MGKDRVKVERDLGMGGHSDYSSIHAHTIFGLNVALKILKKHQ